MGVPVESGATLITGASSGIGLALAERWAAAGSDLIVTARSRDRLDALRTALGARWGVSVTAIPADLADPDGPAALAARVAEHGLSVHTLINNAGFGLHGAFADTPLDRELAMIRLNVTAIVDLTKRLLPAMRARGAGRVVNVASVAAYVPGPYQSVYYASKAFVLSFSEALAEELRGTGITVTAVCPGPVVSGFHQAAGVRRKPGLYDRLKIPARLVAEAAWQGTARGRRVVVPGVRHRLLLATMRLLPRGVALRAAGKTSRPVPS